MSPEAKGDQILLFIQQNHLIVVGLKHLKAFHPWKMVVKAFANASAFFLGEGARLVRPAAAREPVAGMAAARMLDPVRAAAATTKTGSKGNQHSCFYGQGNLGSSH